MGDKLRVDLFQPYRRGLNLPRYVLATWDANRTDPMGKYIIRYRLTERHEDGTAIVIFEGDDFACSPLHAIDSDASIAGLMGFLTLRPGDTDREYFDGYTDRQMEFAQAHAETLGSDVANRFECRDCGGSKERRKRTRCDRCRDRR